MKLSEMRLTQYMDVLASDAGAPGGGSASALTSMVCTLTARKKKYEEHWALNEKTQG